VSVDSAPAISVVIVLYNTADLIAPCLRSVLDSPGASLDVFVVDNASSDGGAAIVRERFPSVRLVENSLNRGFGAANNQVLDRCAGRYIVLLNPDTEVTPGTFRQMADFMDASPRVGLAGPTVRNPTASGKTPFPSVTPARSVPPGRCRGFRERSPACWERARSSAPP